MPSLKALRKRINTVKSTRKITSAMKMIAAARFRRNHGLLPFAQQYLHASQEVVARLTPYLYDVEDNLPALLDQNYGYQLHSSNTSKNHQTRILVMTSDRGMCGNYNANLLRKAKEIIHQSLLKHKNIDLMCYGNKGRSFLRQEFAQVPQDQLLLDRHQEWTVIAQQMTALLCQEYLQGHFHELQVVYNHFFSALNQKTIAFKVLPLALHGFEIDAGTKSSPSHHHTSIYELEPKVENLLQQAAYDLLYSKIYFILSHSFICEDAARMTAMDNSTRNATSLLDKLRLEYNRSRQAFITKELTEIISGAEAA